MKSVKNNRKTFFKTEPGTKGAYQVGNNNLGSSHFAQGTSRYIRGRLRGGLSDGSSRSTRSSSSLRALANAANRSTTPPSTATGAARTFSKDLVERLIKFGRHLV